MIKDFWKLFQVNRPKVPVNNSVKVMNKSNKKNVTLKS